jgi:hypothetical protein
MLQSSMGGQNAILRFNNSSRYLRSRVDREFELGHLVIVNREALKEHGAKTRSSIVISGHFLSYHKLSDSLKCKIDNFLTNSVLTTSIVISGHFLSYHKLSDSAKCKIDNILTNIVVTTSIIISSIFFTSIRCSGRSNRR